MAEEEKKDEQKEEGAAKAEAPVAEAEKPSGGLDLGDDLFDLFTDDDTIDESLLLLTASLDDVDINDLLEQVRELQDIMNERR